MARKHEVNEADRSMFAAMLEGQLENYVRGYSPGEKVKAKVTAVREGFVVLDVRSKHEGLADIAEFADEEGKVSVQPGDVMEVIFVQQREGALLFTRAAGINKHAVADQTVVQAKESGLPLEGLVQKEVTGGYEVTVAGKRAFCPYSQMDLFKTPDAVYVGKKFPFAVMEYDEEEGNLVVSRRMLLERERAAQKEALKSSLQEGQVLKGRVSRLADFGFFVDLGGMDGLVPLRELSWKHGTKPEEVVKAGDEVEVSVVAIDWEKERVSLSLKALMRDPWLDVVEKYPPGAVLEAKVTRIEKFGAFVDLGEGVEGLVGTGRLAGGRRIMSPREVVSEGQMLLLQVETVEHDRRRIGLKPVDERIAKLKPGELAPGMEVKGIVEAYKEFGVFVRLSENKTGLLHVSETEVTQGGSMASKLERAYPPRSEVTLIVKNVEGEKVSLTTPAKWQGAVKSTVEDDTQNFMARQKADRKTFGSLGDAFEGLKL